MRARRFLRLFLPFLLPLVLAACDIAPTERVDQEGALGAPNPGNLDPEDDANLTAFFYAGKPVFGLLYSCSKAGFVEFSGSTDENGQFICPRDTQANFYVGVPRQGTLKIGQVDLSVFGSSTYVMRRNNVLISPATLYGTHVNGSRREIVNIFNILYSLNAMSGGRRQEIIELRPEIMNVAVGQGAFDDLLADNGIRAQTPRFNTKLAALIDAMVDVRGQLTLEQTTFEGSPLGETAAIALANQAFLESRAGLYRTATALIDALPAQVMYAQADIFVARDGRVTGVAYSEERTPSASSYKDPMPVGAAARAFEDGVLDGVVFGTGLDAISLFGAIINNAIWGESRLCNVSSANEMVPSAYCASQPNSGGFTPGDAGRFSTPRGFEGEAMLQQPVAGLPDLDLDKLPPTYSLPKTYSLRLGKYPAIEAADFYSQSHDEVQEDKAPFGAPLTALASEVRYTLMPNGDVVSDADADCAALTWVAAEGRYVDANGTPEFVIGRTGSVFTRRIPNATADIGDDDTDTFIDLYINIIDKDHPQFGFTFGMDATFRSGLHEALLQLSPAAARNEQVRSKSCDPTSRTVCNHPVEWFDNVRYWRDVYAIDQSTPTSVTPADQANYLNVPFFGQILGNTRANTGTPTPTAICDAAPP